MKYNLFPKFLDFYIFFRNSIPSQKSKLYLTLTYMSISLPILSQIICYGINSNLNVLEITSESTGIHKLFRDYSKRGSRGAARAAKSLR